MHNILCSEFISNIFIIGFLKLIFNAKSKLIFESNSKLEYPTLIIKFKPEIEPFLFCAIFSRISLLFKEKMLFSPSEQNIKLVIFSSSILIYKQPYSL